MSAPEEASMTLAYPYNRLSADLYIQKPDGFQILMASFVKNIATAYQLARAAGWEPKDETLTRITADDRLVSYRFQVVRRGE